MSKKKMKNTSKYGALIGAKILSVNENSYCTEIKMKLKNEKAQSMGVYGEGSYSDWWEVETVYNPNNTIAFYDEKIGNETITITFYNSEGKMALRIKGIFHNDSDWDYGCYMHVSCEDLGIREYYYI